MDERTHVYRLTMDQRRKLVEIFFEYGKNYSKSASIFNERFQNRASVQRKTVKRIIQKWKSTNSLCDIKLLHRARPVTEGVTSEDVLTNISQNNRTSLRNIARDCQASKSSVYRVLKTNGYKPYRDIQVQKLQDNDPSRRATYCSWLLNHVDVWNILFTDEAIFTLDGIISQCRIWATENPLETNPSHTLHSPKLMVWAGIMGTHVFGPYFFEGSVKGKMCLLICISIRFIIS